MNIVMTIAGSDSGGGAGIQADIKTFQELGVFGTTAITAVTAQNTLGVAGITPIPADFVLQQIRTVFEDLPVKVVKTGMLFSSDIIKAVAKELANRKELQIVIDPVMIAKGGATLLKQQAIDALVTYLLPIATVITPNIPEAEVLSGLKISSPEHIELVAISLLARGVSCVVIKGGHLTGSNAVDSVFLADGTAFTVEAKRIQTKQTHGTGCTFSAALTAFLAKGLDIHQAILEAKNFVQLAISNPLNIGQGHGPTNHFAYKQLNGDGEVVLHES